VLSVHLLENAGDAEASIAIPASGRNPRLASKAVRGAILFAAAATG